MTQKLFAEFFGTFALVFAGTGAIVINDLSGGVITHVGIALTFPIADKFREAMGTLFPIFYVSDQTLVMQLAAAILVGAAAASLPAWRAAHLRIVDGLRAVG